MTIGIQRKTRSSNTERSPRQHLSTSSTPTPTSPDVRAREHMAPAISLKGVSKSFDTGPKQVDALLDIDLDVRQGEFVVVVGSSGCGKSTLLRLVTGLLKPTSGVVEIGGRPINGPDPGI